ncbi:MAG: TonB-dependent receptor [Flavobacteriaceae bacterium]|nr:TonB-dependent receptor [Flavobacteriaceae bacterium]
MKYLVSCLILLVSANVFSQNTLKGNIKDKQTNITIAFANVYFPELEKGTISDEHGNFELTNLPNGNYKLVVSVIGFETYSSQINLPANKMLDIILSPSAIEMEEIIISTPFHKLQSENVMKVEQQKIADLKANGLVTLSEGITAIPGVESISTGQSIGKPVIRGLSSNRVLVYAQGVRLENQQFGSEHGLGLNDAGIESIEVIKGPASLLYGSDALGGVLYVNPERFAANNTSKGDLNVNYFTNTQGYNTNLGYKASSDHFKFIIRGSLANHADYKTEDYRVTNTRFNERDLKTALGFQNNDFKTEFRYNINSSELGLTEGIEAQNTNRTPLLPYQKINNHIFSSKSTIFLKNSKLNVDIGYTYNDRKEFEEHHDHDDHGDEDEDGHDDEEHEEIIEAALHMKLKTFNYDVKYSLPQMGKFETIFGVQGMNQTNTNYGEELLIPDATTNDVGVLATSHIHFDKADIQLGARFDNRSININDGFNKSFNSFNGAAGVKTNVFKQISLRLNLATGFRAPNLAELASDGTHEGTNRYEIGNADLESEQNFQTDLSLEFKNEHIEVFANAFYNMVNNYIFLSPNGDIIDEDPVYIYLQENANLYGGEFGFHFHPHPLDWLHLQSSFETVTGKQENDDYLPLIPANTINNTIRVEFSTKRLEEGYAFITYRTKLEQNNVSQFETMTDGYSLLSAGFGAKTKLFSNELSFNFSANNITDKMYINHLSRLKSDGIANMGRNFTLGLTYNL